MRVNQFRDRIDTLLSQGLAELSMTLGVLAKIDNGSYEIVAVQSNSGAYVPGEKYDLGQSFSREVFENSRIIADTRIDNSPQSLHHPLYRSLPLESYIGAPIFLDDEIWGCLDFSSMAQREAAFSDAEIERVGDLANEISQLLSELETETAAAL